MLDSSPPTKLLKVQEKDLAGKVALVTYVDSKSGVKHISDCSVDTRIPYSTISKVCVDSNLG
jgi:hypothetical protein